MDLRAVLEERREEPEPLDVIQVEMREEHVDAADLVAHGRAQRPDARPGIQHDQVIVGRAHFDAGRVPAVADRRRPGGRQRPARAP